MEEGDLSQVLAESLRLYGAMVKQLGGVPKPFKPLLGGGEAVVSVRLKGNNVLVVSEFDVDGYEAEIKNLKGKVKEAETEIKSLNILLEKEKETKIALEKERASSMTITVEKPIKEEKQEKPKRKRKKAEVKNE